MEGKRVGDASQKGAYGLQMVIHTVTVIFQVKISRSD